MTLDEEFDVSHVGAWLSFEPDGRVRGQGPCNDIEGEYVFDGTNIEFGEVTASAVGCDTVLADGTDFEEAFLSVLWATEPITVDISPDEAMTWDTVPTLTFER